MELNSKTPIEGHQPVIHTVVLLEKPTYCVWGLKKGGSCVAGPIGKRTFGVEIIPSPAILRKLASWRSGRPE
jgi:hypothetical protein